MKSRFVLIFATALSLASCAERGQMPGKAFEGTITEVIQVPGIADMMNAQSNDSEEAPHGMAMLGAAANMTLKMYVRENKVAYDVSLLGGLISMRSIIDRDARTLTVLLPTHTAMVMDLRSIDSNRAKIDDSLRGHMGIFDSLEAMMPTPTGVKKEMHGLEAEEYHASKGDMETDLWLSSNEKIKAFEVIRDAFLGRAQTGGGGLDQIFGMMRPVAGKIPVKFETKFKGKTFAKGEMTDIVEEKLDDAIFQIPKDYRIENGDSMRHERSHHTDDSVKPERHYTAP